MKMRRTPPASSDSLFLPSELSAAAKMDMPLTPPITPRTPASNVCQSSPSISSFPSGGNSTELNGSSPFPLPSSPPSSRKRGAFPLDISETPSKVVVLSGAPVPVCLDIEEGDSPRKVALKNMVEFLQNQILEDKRKISILQRQVAQRDVQLEQRDAEIDALREIIKKAIDFDVRCVTIDAPLHWKDRALIWIARPALVGQ
ncbi:uncharacterized protein LOC117649591 [Thrips palmi]|uniref:Uncharacterized protein LOC117649591 n=1 Tax=Thrips palmi TaxID=161013 RepID=A0A6P8ZSZ1_THRPL|nr:uncharacterized protein LOC117649591 [Thrips palmi]